MKNEFPWNDYRALWHAAPQHNHGVDVQRIRRRLHWQRIGMALIQLSEVLLLLGLLGMLWHALRVGWPWLHTLWLLLGLIYGVGLMWLSWPERARRWQLNRLDTASWLQQRIEYLRSRLRSARLMRGAVWGFAALLHGWLALGWWLGDAPAFTGTSLLHYGLALVWLGAAAVLAEWLRRRNARELRFCLRQRAPLTGD